MTRDAKRAQLRRRIGITSVLLVVGGAVVGAALASRRTREPRRAVPAVGGSARTDGAARAAAPNAQPPAGRPAERGPMRRVSAGVAYGLAVALLVSGLGVVGVAMASQQDVPAVPLTQADVGRPAVAPGSLTPPRQQRAAEQPAPLTLPRSRPVALHIPAIDVRSVVRPLGLTDEGELQTPSGPQYDDAGWYRHSPAPGSLGPAILLGHVDSAADGPSVFFRLGELRVGDRVSVTRADGTMAVFSVDDVRRFAKSDFPTARVYGDIEHAGLRILTCGGPFDEVSGHYRDNVIVFASLLDT